jgi:hypothetical protein
MRCVGVLSIGKQRDMTILNNLIRRKFGEQPLLVLGDKSTTRNLRFHAPTQGVGLRYQLHRLGFRVVLLDEYRTSSSCRTALPIYTSIA